MRETVASRSDRVRDFTAATRSSSERWDGMSIFMVTQYHTDVHGEDRSKPRVIAVMIICKKYERLSLGGCFQCGREWSRTLPGTSRASNRRPAEASRPQCGQQCLQVRGQRARERNALARDGMGEGQVGG